MWVGVGVCGLLGVNCCVLFCVGFVLTIVGVLVGWVCVGYCCLRGGFGGLFCLGLFGFGVSLGLLFSLLVGFGGLFWCGG